MQLYSKSSMNVSALVFKVQVNNLIAQANSQAGLIDLGHFYRQALILANFS